MRSSSRFFGFDPSLSASEERRGVLDEAQRCLLCRALRWRSGSDRFLNWSMAGKSIGCFLLITTLGMAGCNPVGQYPALPRPFTEQKEIKELFRPDDFVWTRPEPTWDIPIKFISSTAKEWKRNSFWEPYPNPKPGMGSATAALGLAPLQAAATLVALIPREAIHVHVPLGLPDPSSHIPPANQPTYGKWLLGRKLFFDKLLLGGKKSCASCHRPSHGFSEDVVQEKVHTPSLINSVYNRHQFWDGRAVFLEEVLVRRGWEEKPSLESKETLESLAARHAWGGMLKIIDKDREYFRLFRQAFGQDFARQDYVAQALATYMRTILSGDSLYDKAEQERKKRGDSFLKASHFLPHLDEVQLDRLKSSGLKKEKAAEELERGGWLFFGWAGCAQCHPGPLFTDGDFHNIGIEEIRDPIRSGMKTGRFLQVPIGLKEVRLIGAYKTPSLRRLARTEPFMHDGSFGSLDRVVEYFDKDIGPNESLARVLLQENTPRKLKLEERDTRALVLFLRALDGEAIDPILTSLPEEKKKK